MHLGILDFAKSPGVPVLGAGLRGSASSERQDSVSAIGSAGPQGEMLGVGWGKSNSVP